MTQLNTKIWPSILYFALYPSFFIYHYLVGKQIVPMFAYGWATVGNAIVSAVLGVFIFTAFYQSKRKIEFHFFHTQAALFFLLILFYAFFYHQYGLPHQQQPDVFEQSIKLVLGLCALYFIGLVFADNKYSKYMLIYSTVLMMIIIAVCTDWPRTFFTLPETKVPSGIVSDYQGFATSFAVTGILALGFMRRPWSIAMFTALCSLSLFLIGSRADMVGFVVASGVWVLVLAAQRSFKNAFILAAAAVTPIAFFLMMPAFDGFGYFEGNFRQDELLDITESESFTTRKLTFASALHGISASPILGDYAGQVKEYGAFGMYAHNFVSAWQQFGLLGFMLYLCLTLAAFGYSAWHVFIKKNFKSGLLKATLLISSYSLFLIILSKPVFWPVPALAWGLCASHYSAMRSLHYRLG